MHRPPARNSLASLLVLGSACVQLLLVSSVAQASDTATLAPSQLSLSGDGVTPSAVDLLERSSRHLKSASYGVGATDQGDATFGFDIPLPPALLQPSLSLQYSSGGGVTEVGRGWSLSAGVEVLEPVGHRRQGYDEGTYLVRGGGLFGDLLPLSLAAPLGSRPDPDPNAVIWQSTQPGFVESEYVAGEWVLESGGVRYTLSEQSAHRWVLTRMEDSSGNYVVYDWVGTRLEEIEYGGNVNSGHLRPHRPRGDRRRNRVRRRAHGHTHGHSKPPVLGGRSAWLRAARGLAGRDRAARPGWWRGNPGQQDLAAGRLRGL